MSQKEIAEFDPTMIFQRLITLRAQITMMYGDGLAQFRGLSEDTMSDVLDGLCIQLCDLEQELEPLHDLTILAYQAQLARRAPTA